MIPLLPIFSDVPLLLLRLTFGVIFLAHGWPKLKDLATNAQNFEMMGFKPGKLWGTIVALAEVACGLAVIIGFGVQYAGLILAFNMTVATIWKMKRGQKLVGGFELDITLLAIGLLLATLGGGAYALDNYLGLF